LSLGQEGETKKLIGMVVVIGLLINFSLFFSKVIIDSSNILAKIFYNAIEVTDKSGAIVVGALGEKSVSVAVASKFNPQSLFLNEDVTTLKYKDKDGNIQTDSSGSQGSAYAAYFALVSLLAAGINVVAIVVFFVVALLFIGRTLGLWLVMIFAPFAFISYIVPKMGGVSVGGFGHQKWWGDLLGLSFMAPIFLFFLYLIVMFLESGPIQAAFGSGDDLTTTQTILNIVFPLAIIAMLLIKAKNIAKKLAGEAGAAVLGAAKVVGAAALGGAGLAVAGAAGAGALAARTAARAPGALKAARRFAQAPPAVRKRAVRMAVSRITRRVKEAPREALRRAARIEPLRVARVARGGVTRPIMAITGIRPTARGGAVPDIVGAMKELATALRGAGGVKSSDVQKSVS